MKWQVEDLSLGGRRLAEVDGVGALKVLAFERIVSLGDARSSNWSDLARVCSSELAVLAAHGLPEQRLLRGGLHRDHV